MNTNTTINDETTITFNDVCNDDNETFNATSLARALNIDCKRARARLRANERDDNDATRVIVHRINNAHTYARDEFDNVRAIITRDKR